MYVSLLRDDGHNLRLFLPIHLSCKIIMYDGTEGQADGS